MTRLPAIALACLVLGVVLMVVLDLIWLGVILLFVFIVAGIFAIADPAFLADDDPQLVEPPTATDDVHRLARAPAPERRAPERAAELQQGHTAQVRRCPGAAPCRSTGSKGFPAFASCAHRWPPAS